MTFKSPRQVMSIGRQAQRQCRARISQPLSRPIASSATPFSSTASRAAELPDVRDGENDTAKRPRWSYTPEDMTAPFSLNVPKDPRRQVWQVNDDPAMLDAAYCRLLGRDGDRMLPEETKWLAVTHKSFDQGRRGFNSRLAYFGRQIIALEATRSILFSPATSAAAEPDPYGRTPFEHQALASVDKLGERQPRDMVGKEKLAQLAMDVRLHEVVRWKPRLPENLEASGFTVVLTSTIFAIVGAISLQHGAEVAGRVVREKIFKRIGA